MKLILDELSNLDKILPIVFTVTILYLASALDKTNQRIVTIEKQLESLKLTK